MKELTIEKNVVTIDGSSREVDLTLPSEITAVQYHASINKCLEEPLMTEVELSKYQNFVDAHQAIIHEETRDLTPQEQEKENIIIQISDAKLYLQQTDYKVLPDYDKTENIEDIKSTRQAKRELIRQLEASLVEVQ